MNRPSFFRGVVAAVSGLAGAVYGLGWPRVGPDGLTNEDIDHDLMRRDPSCKGRTYWVDPAPPWREQTVIASARGTTVYLPTEPCEGGGWRVADAWYERDAV